jgi:DNA-directed RNA polymerase specialized sigma subunit
MQSGRGWEVRLLIAWRYLDKQQATLNALSDYRNMETVIEITPAEIKKIKNDMSNPRGSKYDGMPHTRDPQSGENIICSVIYKCDVLRNRYQQAIEFMSWFNPAWLELNDEERLILEEFYMSDGSKTNAVCRISDRLFVEKSQVYNKKDKALDRLTTFLYGA